MGEERRRAASGVQWVADEEAPQCTGCNAAFTLLNRRHHCRVCGKIFCGPCSNATAPLPDFDRPQRACAGCAMAVSAMQSRQEDAEEEPNPSSQRTSMGWPAAPNREAAAEIVKGVLDDSEEVLEGLPSHRFSVWLAPHARQRFSVDLATAELWDESMGRLQTAGHWPGSPEAQRRPGQLGRLVQPMAEAAARREPRINFREGAAGFCVGEIVRVLGSEPGTDDEEGQVLEVRAADALSSGDDVPVGAVKVLFVSGLQPARWFGPKEAKARLRGSNYRVGQARQSLSEFIGDPEAAESLESPVPNNLSTRVGGVYHETLALHARLGAPSVPPQVGRLVGTKFLQVDGDARRGELMASGLVQVFGEGGESEGSLPTALTGRHGRVDTRPKAWQLFQLIRFAAARWRNAPPRDGRWPMRVRICSLLNALVLDPRERSFFNSQISVLTEPPGRAEAADGGTAEAFDFAAAMQGELGADFACLNFVANWPLCLRLGAGPPAGKHNALHLRGLRKHLVWLAQDMLQALEKLPNGAPPSLRTLKQLAADDASVQPWRDGLPAVLIALEVLKGHAKDAATKEACNRFFMAAELLGGLSKCQGTTFRRRAAELLQLCVLEHILGVLPFFNCKSGIDRTGLTVALWTTFQQLVAAKAPNVWLWHYLALTYPVLVKVVHGLHDCGKEDAQGQRSLPLQQLRENCLLAGGASLLPFPPEGEGQRELYAEAERLCGICGGGPGSSAEQGAARQAFLALQRLFFAGPEALLPQLQAGFLANVLGIATKVAIASTGVHGLKYGDSAKNSGQFNSLAAQFMPRAICCSETGTSVAITEVRKALMSVEVAFSPEVHPYLIGSSVGRGT